jgi:hypothetical protein
LVRKTGDRTVFDYNVRVRTQGTSSSSTVGSHTRTIPNRPRSDKLKFHTISARRLIEQLCIGTSSASTVIPPRFSQQRTDVEPFSP